MGIGKTNDSYYYGNAWWWHGIKERPNKTNARVLHQLAVSLPCDGNCKNQMDNLHIENHAHIGVPIGIWIIKCGKSKTSLIYWIWIIKCGKSKTSLIYLKILQLCHFITCITTLHIRLIYVLTKWKVQLYESNLLVYFTPGTSQVRIM